MAAVLLLSLAALSVAVAVEVEVEAFFECGLFARGTCSFSDLGPDPGVFDDCSLTELAESVFFHGVTTVYLNNGDWNNEMGE